MCLVEHEPILNLKVLFFLLLYFFFSFQKKKYLNPVVKIDNRNPFYHVGKRYFYHVSRKMIYGHTSAKDDYAFIDRKNDGYFGLTLFDASEST